MGTAAVIVGGAIIGAASSSRASKRAAKAQQAGIDTATGEQRRQFDITQENLQPFQQAGQAAIEQQRILLGLGGGQTDTDRRRQEIEAQIEELTGRQQEAAGSEVSRGGRFGAARSAAAKVAGRAMSSQLEDLQKELSGLPESGPQLSAREQQEQAFAALNESPGQQFLRARAQKNLLRNASAIGGLGGGNVRSALVQQGVGFAQQDLQNQFGRLGQLAGQGQSAATSIGQFGQTTAGNIGNLAVQGGNVRASGIQQRNQIFQQALGQFGTAFGQLGSGGNTQQFNQNFNTPFTSSLGG